LFLPVQNPAAKWSGTESWFQPSTPNSVLPSCGCRFLFHASAQPQTAPQMCSWPVK
jgi:hypothetical protein